MNNIPPRNSKELKLPPNNINININFTVKEPNSQPLNPLAKPLVGKKIDNFVHVSSNARPEVRRTNVTTETLKDRRRQLLQEQDSTQMLKTKRLDVASNQQPRPPKRKERSAKVSQTHQEVVQTAFSTSKAKNKNYSRQLREMFARGGQEAVAYLNNNPTPIKQQQSGDKTRRKSAERERNRRVFSNQKQRNPKSSKLTHSVQNLRRHRGPLADTHTPSKSKSKSKSSSKGSSTKRHNIPVPSIHNPLTQRHRVFNSHSKTRRSQIGLEFLNQLEESEIKQILKKSRKSSYKKGRSGSEADGHKFTEEELAEIRAYMVEKKRKIEREKGKKEEEEKHRLEKMRDSLSKVEVERRRGISMGTVPPQGIEKKKKKPKGKGKSTIMSTKNQEKEYDQLREQAMQLLGLPGQSKTDRYHEDSKTKHVTAGSSSKKDKQKSNKKQPLKSLIDRYHLREPQYFNEDTHQQEYIKNCVIKIQSVVRGFLCRRRTLQQIKSIRNRVKVVQQQIKHKGLEFWDDNTNSIKHLQNDIDHSDSNIANPHQPSPQNISPDYSWQEPRSDHEDSQEQGSSAQIYKMIEKLEKNKSKDGSNPALMKKLRTIAEAMRNKEDENIRIAKEIQELRKKDSAQKGKGSLDVEEVVSEEEHPGTFDSQDRPHEENLINHFNIRIPMKISPPETKKADPQPKPQIKPEELKPEPKKQSPPPSEPPQQDISQQEKEARLHEIDILKKFKQQSDKMMSKVKKTDLVIDPNAPPTNNPKLPALKPNPEPEPVVLPPTHSLPSPKHQQSNILQLLRQKQKLLNDKHRLSAEEINNLYRNKLVSPRSYNMRLNQLEKIIQERNAIQRSMSEAERIIELVKSIEKDKQDVKKLQERTGEIMGKEEEGKVVINKKLDFKESKKEETRPVKKEEVIKPKEETKPKQQIKPKEQIKKKQEIKQPPLKQTKPLAQPKQPQHDEDDYSNSGSLVQSLGINNSSGVSNFSQDHEGNFMQPLPIPIEPRKIESIFKSFGQQQEQEEQTDKKNTIISIFEQSSLDSKPDMKKVQQQVDHLNNEMIEFVEQNRSAHSTAEKAAAEEQEETRPNFDTNLNFVKEYCIGLCEFIRANPTLKDDFKRQIVTPLIYNPQGFLQSYRRTENGLYSNEYNSMRKDLMYPYYREQNTKQEAITQNCFQRFNMSFQKLKQNQPNFEILTAELQSYHLKCILDAFNEALNYQRPNSVYGKPMPWCHNPKYLKNVNSKFQQAQNDEDDYTQQDQKFDHIFGVAIARIIQWGSSLCGFIPEALELQRGQVLQIDEEYINHIKQTRMALMLEKTLAEDEEKLLEFSDEETEIKLEVTNKIVEMLCDELTKEWAQMTKSPREELAKSQYFEYIQD